MESRRRSTRQSRDQAVAIDEPEFDDSFLFAESGVLPQITPRPGYAQYWARAMHGNNPDARNMLRMKQRGWKPRPADTVPVVFADLAGDTGVISTHDLILMERPAKLQKRVVDFNKDVVDNREKAVKRNIFQDHQKLGGTDTGFTAPEREDRARVEKGVLQDD